ncbi:unnamed protein product [Cuscuta campestris]|uniref:feruloyl-CoA 6-hydroxylase n=1 Tax=Cuscuta campestris TaxID=132261 RepID=A0A484NIT1_9ASTE|nr:unnamed protein product [Cuscuta campestris]
MSNIPNYQSYPPPFRPPANQNLVAGGAETAPALDPPTTVEGEDGVPVIDFERLTEHDDGGEEKITAACRDWGLFRLVNHGIPELLLSQMLDRTERMFSMSFEEKQAVSGDGMSYFWGTPAVAPSGAALPTNGSSLHWMEGFNVPLSRVSLHHYEDETLESFRLLLEEYGKHQRRVAKAIYQALSINQNLGEEKPTTTSYISEDTGILRLYRYPRCHLDRTTAAAVEEEEETMNDRHRPPPPWGIGAHTDSSLLSILHQDLVGGLQAYHSNNNKNQQCWVEVKPIPNTLIVIVGDMMQAISNDKYVSAKHRVKVKGERERISMGYFVFPEEEAVIESSRYTPFTYAEFRAQVHRELKTAGSKILGLHAFKRESPFLA